MGLGGDPIGVDELFSILRVLCKYLTKRSSVSRGSCDSLLFKLLSVRLTDCVLSFELLLLGVERLLLSCSGLDRPGSRIQGSKLDPASTWTTEQEANEVENSDLLASMY